MGSFYPFKHHPHHWAFFNKKENDNPPPPPFHFSHFGSNATKLNSPKQEPTLLLQEALSLAKTKGPQAKPREHLHLLSSPGSSQFITKPIWSSLTCPMGDLLGLIKCAFVWWWAPYKTYNWILEHLIAFNSSSNMLFYDSNELIFII